MMHFSWFCCSFYTFLQSFSFMPSVSLPFLFDYPACVQFALRIFHELGWWDLSPVSLVFARFWSWVQIFFVPSSTWRLWCCNPYTFRVFGYHSITPLISSPFLPIPIHGPRSWIHGLVRFGERCLASLHFTHYLALSDRRGEMGNGERRVQAEMGYEKMKWQGGDDRWGGIFCRPNSEPIELKGPAWIANFMKRLKLGCAADNQILALFEFVCDKEVDWPWRGLTEFINCVKHVSSCHVWQSKGEVTGDYELFASRIQHFDRCLVDLSH